MSKFKVTVFLTAFISSTLSASISHASCEAEIFQAAQKHNIPQGILYSVGLTETGRKGSLHPYALNVEGKAYFAENVDHAMRIFGDAKSRNKRLIDIGCMQINHYYHAPEFSSTISMFDPKLNVEYAAKFLAHLKRRHKSWTMAVARYHAGPNNDPAQKKYVCRVISNLVTTGYGNWTPEARAFCNA